MANVTYYSPEGNPEVWPEGQQPTGYLTPEEWAAAHPVTLTLEEAQAQKLAELQSDCDVAAAQGIPYDVGTVGTAVKLLMSANFEGTYDSAAKTLTQTTPAPLETDGVDPIYNDRILLTGQTDPTQNGIYVITELGGEASNGLATLTLAGDTITAGLIIQVKNGTTYGGTSWQVGSDLQAWTQYTPAHVATDLESRANMTAAVAMYNAEQILPSPWKAGGQWIPISSKDDLMNLAQAMYKWVEDCYKQLQTLGAQVSAAATADDVLTIQWSDPA